MRYWVKNFLKGIKHVEPILALAVSLYATYLGYNGIQLTYQGLLVSQETLKEERRMRLIERAPVLAFVTDASEHSISIANAGLGPAHFYHLEMKFEGASISLGQDTPDDIGKLRSFFRDSLAKIDEPLADIDFSFDVPLRLLRQEQQVSLIKFHGNIADEQFLRLTTGLTARFCYADLTGDLTAELVTGDAALYSKMECGTFKPMIRSSMIHF